MTTFLAREKRRLRAMGNDPMGGMRRIAAMILILGLAQGAAACAMAVETESTRSISLAGDDARSDEFMAVTAHPAASRAAVAILSRGGSAVDAAIAAQMVLTVVEPQSSGIGGGGFLLYFDEKSGRIDAYDGRERAPAAMPADAFLDRDGRERSFRDASTGGMAVGVPGLLAMLKMAHDDHGRRPWAELFEDAILTARQGFPLSERLHESLEANRDLHTLSPALPFFDAAGNPRGIGSPIRSEALARTLEILARDPLDSFYHGPIARRIVERVRHAPKDPGVMTMADMASMKPRRRPPLCGEYRHYRLCGMPLPTSGTIAILQMLSILSHFPCCRTDILDVETITRVGAAQNAIYDERGRTLGDDDYVDVDLDTLLDPRRLEEIARELSFEPKNPGPPGIVGSTSTTHLSIIDAQGNAVTMTSSVGPAFGSKLSVDGFLLNGELTDFHFRPFEDGVPRPNRIQGGKRPLSSMSPIFVFDPNDRLRLVIGSPGGSRIIAYVLQTILAVLDYDMPIDQAVALPHFLHRRGVIELEEGRLLDQARQLRRDGHTVRSAPMISGLHGITVDEHGRMHGGADPRREGRAMGPPS